MERRIKTFRQANAILMSDVHLREDQPVCRTDDFQAAMWRKIDFISVLQWKHKCPVLCGGDLFNHWKPSPELLTKAYQHLPDQFYSIYGQHDLPQHSLELQHKSGLYNLIQNEKVKLLRECSWGQIPNPKVNKMRFDGRDILVWHIYNYAGKTWPGNTSPKAGKLLRQYPQYDLILTGDNHKPFVEEHEGRLLVNPGSLMRSTADQADFKPRVYLWYAEDNTVEAVYLPIEEGVINRDHIEIKEQRANRVNAFIEHLNDTWEAGLTFEENLELFEKSNDTNKKVMEIVFKAVGL